MFNEKREVKIEYNEETYTVKRSEIIDAFEDAENSGPSARVHFDGREKAIVDVLNATGYADGGLGGKVTTRLEEKLHELGIQTNQYARLDSRIWIEKRDHSSHRGNDDPVQALGCPKRTPDGEALTYYENLNRVNTTDRHGTADPNLILHLDEATGEFWAISVADGTAETTTLDEIPAWENKNEDRDPGERSAYRVDLRAFHEFENPLDVDEVFCEESGDVLQELLEDPKHILVYDEEFDLVDEAYLTEVPPELYDLIEDRQREFPNGLPNPQVLAWLIEGPDAVDTDEFTVPDYLHERYLAEVPDTIDDLLDEPDPPEPLRPGPDQLIEGIDEVEFSVPDHLYYENKEEIENQIEATLNSGKNIIFTGPPGTGKTELATEIGELAREEFDQVGDYTFTTATADWTAFDTIGGHVPDDDGDGITFQPRIFLECFRDESGIRNDWLVIDEINRSDIDKAFGQLFSVLAEDSVELPYTREDQVEVRWVEKNENLNEIQNSTDIFPVTPSWRLIATMNTYDKASLYEMSYAFMRRFNFIHIPVPELETDDHIKTSLLDPSEESNFATVWDKEVLLAEDDLYKDVAVIWAIVNRYRKIGPSIVMDMLEYVEAYPGDDEQALTNAIVSLVFPQMEGMRPDRQKKLVRAFDGPFETADGKIETIAVETETLKDRATDFFDLDDFEDNE